MITLTTLEMATAQEVFDQVAKHLLTQKRRSKVGKNCLYRSPAGLKCAAGSLISDEEVVRFDQDGEDWRSLAWTDLIEAGVAPMKHGELILELQWLHDHRLLKDWPRALYGVAEEFGLKTTVLPKIPTSLEPA